MVLFLRKPTRGTGIVHLMIEARMVVFFPPFDFKSAETLHQCMWRAEQEMTHLILLSWVSLTPEDFVRRPMHNAGRDFR